jgi:hypothetical protein
MNQFLASFAEDQKILLPVLEQFREDLKIWAAIVTDSIDWLPIGREVDNPP